MWPDSDLYTWSRPDALDECTAGLGSFGIKNYTKNKKIRGQRHAFV